LSVLRDDVRAIAAYPVPSAVGFIKLDAMENPFPLPDGLQRQLAERLARQPLNRYPMSDPRGFKERLGKAVGVPPGMALMLGNGSDELIHLVIQACAKPGAVVLAPAPSFVMYEMSARFDGCKYVGVPLAADFALDGGRMLAAIAEHRPAVSLHSVSEQSDRQSVRSHGNRGAAARRARRRGPRRGIPAVRAGHVHAAAVPLAEPAGAAHAVEAWTGGHPARLPGGPCDWIEQLDKVRPPYNVNVLTLAVADLMLENMPLLDAQAVAIRAERARLAAALKALPGVTPFASAANFILFRVAAPDRVFSGLKERGILIKNLAGSHPLLAGCLRVTVGTSSENEAFIKALRATLETLR
jgi:histidinol-phosphate aminotransferase